MSVDLERTPERRAVRAAAAKAMRSGDLVRQPCSVCGKARSVGHHEDYGKPLDITWLCHFHHSARHSAIAEARA